jgi:uncharacterized protein
MRLRLALFLIAALFWAGPLSALDVPPAQGYVQDRAGLLQPATVQKLEQFLNNFDKTDSTQIAILTIPSLEGEALKDYTLRVAESWGIGRKGHDNGALLLIARDDRRVRIEVGYGLEDRITDLLAGRIIDQEITPRFRSGDFDGGVLAGTQAMVDAVRGAYQGEGATTQRKRKNPWGLLALLLFLGPGLLRLGLGGSRRGHYRRGGIYFGGPGGFGGRSSGGFGGFGGGGFGGGGSSGSW